MDDQRTPQQIKAHEIINAALEQAASVAGHEFVSATLCAAAAAECVLAGKSPEDQLAPYMEQARTQVAALRAEYGSRSPTG